MAVSKVTINIQDGNLGLPGPSGAQLCVHLDVCTLGVPGQFYNLSSPNTVGASLGLGSGAELASYALAISSPIGFIPVEPDVAGSVGSVSHVGTGTGSIAVSVAPLKQMTVLIVDSGGPGTGTYKVQLGSDAYGPVQVIPGVSDNYTARPLGVYSHITFSNTSYSSNDGYVFDTLGGSTGVPTTPGITCASDPVDDYNPILTIVGAGGVGTAKGVISLDGGRSQLGGAFVLSAAVSVANTGLVLTPSGTFVVGDTYEFLTCGPTSTNSDFVNAAENVITNTPYSLIHFNNKHATSSLAAAFASLVVEVASSEFASDKFLRCIVNTPSANMSGIALLGGATGSVATSTGSLVQCSDSKSTIETSFLNIVDTRISVVAYDALTPSILTGLVLRRNFSFAAVARLASLTPAVDAAWVELGGVNVLAISADERLDEGLSDAGFTVPATIVGKPGIFINEFLTMAFKENSDYSYMTDARVMDLACTISYNIFVNYLNAAVLVDPNTGDISNPQAIIIENRANNSLRSQMIAVNPQQASAVSTSIDRANDILLTNELIATIVVTPLGYARGVSLTIGFGLQ